MTLIRFDENISPRVVAAIRAIGTPAGVDVEHPSELGQLGLADVDWLHDFKSRGGRCIVTGDPKMRANIAERVALQATGLIAVFPPRRGGWYASLRLQGQAAYMLRWFQTIAEIAATAAPGDHFLLPPTFDVDPAKVERLRPLSGPLLPGGR